MKYPDTTRLLCALLTAAFVLAAGGFCLAEEADFLGIWYLNTIEIVGEPVHPSYLHTEETLTIHADGRAEVHSVFEGEVHEATAEWSLRDGELIAVYENGSEIVYALDGGNLCMENEVMRRVYGREKIEGFVEPTPRTDALREEFDGLWSLTYVTIPGWGTFPWETLFDEDSMWFVPEETWLLRIEGDTARWIYSVEDAADLRYSCSLKNGCLFLNSGIDEMRAELNTDGTLSCYSFYNDDSAVIHYFERLE